MQNFKTMSNKDLVLNLTYFSECRSSALKACDQKTAIHYREALHGCEQEILHRLESSNWNLGENFDRREGHQR